MIYDSLGDRMKGYEAVPRIGLVKRVPVVIRVDGKAFHTLTRGLQKPYDPHFNDIMWHTAHTLCKEIQGAQLGYVQSDEISVLLIDYQTHETQGWFQYEVQKIVSIAAAIATSAFSDAFRGTFTEKYDKGARPLFDARAFNVPREDVANYFIWRQQDATRNSIQSYGQAHFSHKQLHGVSCDKIQDLLFKEKGINWNDAPTWVKRGVTVVRSTVVDNGVERSKWVCDMSMPILTQDRQYVERFVDLEDLDRPKQDEASPQKSALGQ